MDEETVSPVVGVILMLAAIIALGSAVFILVDNLGGVMGLGGLTGYCESEATHEQVEDYGDHEIVTVTTYCLDADGRIKGHETEEYYRGAS